jgi:hypothetical protein
MAKKFILSSWTEKMVVEGAENITKPETWNLKKRKTKSHTLMLPAFQKKFTILCYMFIISTDRSNLTRE